MTKGPRITIEPSRNIELCVGMRMDFQVLMGGACPPIRKPICAGRTRNTCDAASPTAPWKC